MRFFSLFILSMIVSTVLHGQRDTLGRYSPGFKFRDGVYLTFDDFKSNCPSINKNELYDEFGQNLTDIESDIVWYTLANDSLIPVSQDTIWGFSNRGKIFLRNQDFFDRLVVIGTLCHIIHREEFFDYNNAMYNGFTYAPVRREIQTEFFLDMRTGDKLEFNTENLSDYINDDPILHGSFEQLSRKKKKESMFRYLHSYNQKYPVYFPISKCRR